MTSLLQTSSKRRPLSWRVYAALLFVGAFLPRAIYPVSRPLHWYSWSLHFISAVLRGDWGATYMKEHPGVFPMWLSGVGLSIRRLMRGESLIALKSQDALKATVTPQAIAAGMIPLALVIALEIVLAYFLLRRLTHSSSIAMVGSALLALDPFHIANSKALLVDATLSTTMLISALFGLCYILRGGRWRDIILSGVFGGLAMLTKMPAILLAPWIGLILLIGWWLKDKQSKGRSFSSAVIVPALLWGLIAAFVFVALWPSMWVHPRWTLADMYRAATSYADQPHNHPNYFMGEVVTTDQGPWFYPITCIKETTFLTFSFCIVALLLLPIAWRKQRRQASVVLTCLGYALAYGLMMTSGAKKGVRYILPVFPALDVVAAFGLAWFLERMKRVLRIHRLVPAVLAGAILAQALVALPYHPYYDVHDNLLIGGQHTGRRLIAPMEQGEGLDLAAQYLNSLPNASDLRVGTQMSIAFERYFKGQTVSFTDPTANYLVFAQNTVTRRTGIEEWGTLWDAYKFASPERKIVLGGIPYVWIYRATRDAGLIIEDIEHPQEARLGDEIEYLGYDVFPAHQITPGGVLELRMAWRAHDAIEANYSVFVHLLNDEGELIAQQDNWPVRGTRPTVTWEPGEIIADHYSLPIPLHTPPGRYKVYAGIYGAGTGERLSVEMDSTSQPHNRLKITNIIIDPLLPRWIWIFDFIWLGTLLVGILLAYIPQQSQSEEETLA